MGGLLSVSSAVELYFSYQETKQSIVRLERTKALAAANEIERYLGQIVEHLRSTMQGAIDVSALGTAGIGVQAGGHSRAAALADQREIDFLRLLRNVPAITEVRHLDLAGKEQLRMSRLALDAVGSGKDYADAPEFVEAKSKKTYISPVYFRNESEPFITIAVAPDETAAEVTAADINIRAIWDVVARIGTGRAGNAYVVDSTDQLIAHPDLRLVLAKRDLSDAPQVKAARAPRAGSGQDEQMFTIAEGLQGGQALAVHAAIPALGWLVFIERPVEDTFAPLRAATARSVVVLALGLLLAILASVALARRMVAPIRGCRTVRRASAGATSIIVSTSAPATSSRRLPTSSTAPPRGCRIRRATWSKRSRRAQRRSRARSKKCARSAKSARRSARPWTWRPCC